MIVNSAYDTTVITRVKIIKVWSWNEMSCSIIGEAASWRRSWPQVILSEFLVNWGFINNEVHIAFTYYGIVITPVSLKLWKSRGRISAHSIDDGM